MGVVLSSSDSEDEQDEINWKERIKQTAKMSFRSINVTLPGEVDANIEVDTADTKNSDAAIESKISDVDILPKINDPKPDQPPRKILTRNETKKTQRQTRSSSRALASGDNEANKPQRKSRLSSGAVKPGENVFISFRKELTDSNKPKKQT